MNDSNLVQIADILPPPAPELLSADYGSYFALILILLLASILILAMRSSRWQLRKLRWLYQLQKIDNRQLAFQLVRLLRKRLNLSRIDPSLLPEFVKPEDGETWLAFTTQLKTACYSRHSLNDKAMTKLLHRTNQWL